MFACNAQMYIHPFLGQKEMKIPKKKEDNVVCITERRCASFMIQDYITFHLDSSEFHMGKTLLHILYNMRLAT